MESENRTTLPQSSRIKNHHVFHMSIGIGTQLSRNKAMLSFRTVFVISYAGVFSRSQKSSKPILKTPQKIHKFQYASLRLKGANPFNTFSVQFSQKKGRIVLTVHFSRKQSHPTINHPSNHGLTFLRQFSLC